jgi:outer membrane protein assembly factor BamB
MARFGLQLVGLLLLLGTCSLLVAQPGKDAVPPVKLAGNSPRTAGRLATPQGHVAAQRWSEAIAEFQAILDEAGDDVMPADPRNSDHCISVRRLCQMHLAAMPAAGLRTYRGRFDEPAQKALDTAGRDAARLRRVVDNYFCARAAETAIDLLGDLAFERGDFAEAEQWWRMLALPCSESALKPSPTGAVLRLACPDPQTDLAMIRAKMILAEWFHGNGATAAEELKAFRKVHPNSEGMLAGRTGNYAATLQTVLSKPPTAVTALESWPTFAGDSARNGMAARALRVHWLEKPERASLDAQAPNPLKPAAPAPGPPRNPSEAAQSLAFFPVIVGDRVLVADSRYVSVFDLLTGKRLSRFDLMDNRAAAAALIRLDPHVPVANGQRYTLTVDGDRVYVRLGATVTSLTPEKLNGNPDAGPAESFLVCLRLSPENQLSLRWLMPAVTNDQKEAAFYEGSPLVHRGRLYIGRTRLLPTGNVSQIECLDAETGLRHWRQDISMATELTEPNEPRQRQHLLTLAGSNVVYCTHSGAVGAVDAATGKRAWAVRYPRRAYRRIDGQPLPRDLSPALYSAGRIYVAPADADRLFCLDAATGKTLWESKPLEVVQLLNVIKGKLIFTTGSFPRGIRGLDAVTGADIRQWMHPEGGHGELPSMGRGIFAGGLLYWPTSEGLRILKEDGQPDTENFVPLGSVPCGNLAISNGSVVIATDRELLFFPSPARLLEQRKKAAAAEPKSLTALYQLAMAEADAGLLDAAQKHFQQVAELAPGLRDWSFVWMIEPSRRKQQECLLGLAQQQHEQRDPRWVETSIAASNGRSIPLQIQAWANLADWSERDGNHKQSASGWLYLLDRPQRLCSLMSGPDGCPQMVPNRAAAEMEALKRMHGPAVVAQAEKDYEGALRAAREKDPEMPEEQVVGQFLPRYPCARAPHTRLVHLVDQYESRKDHESAAFVHRLRLRFNSEPAERAAALAGLARAYEGMRCWEAASFSWQRLSREHGDLRLGSLDSKRPIHSVVSERLALPVYLDNRRAAAELRLPLSRSWEVRYSGGERYALLPSPGALGPRAATAFRDRDGQLYCRDAGAGTKLWSQLSADWVGYQGDTLVAGGDRGIFHMRQSDGYLFWGFSLYELAEGDLGQFRMNHGRLFFQQDNRRLFAVDVETGQFLWHRWAPAAQIRPTPPAGKFQPWYHAGRDRLLIQTSLGVPLLLDSLTGNELPCSLRAGIWLCPPLAVSEQHVCVVPDHRHVVLFDLVSGREVWTHTIENPTLLNGQPPQLLTDGQNLVLGVRRNTGFEIDRLDLDTGERRWKSPTIIRREPFDLTRGALDRGAVYVVSGSVLEAISLADGKRIWDRPLTAADGGWQVLAAKNALLVHPVQAQPELDAVALWRRSALLDFPSLLPTLAPLPVNRAAGSASIRIRQEQVPSRFSLLVCDPKDGQLIQRFNFASRGTSASVRVSPQGIVVATPGAAWGIR